MYQHIQQNPDLQKIPLVVMSGRKEEVVEKLPEPFEYFEFIPKPFEQKDLIGAIKSAMAKSKLPRKPAHVQTAIPAATVAVAAGTAETQVLTDKIATMQVEIERLKQQMAQVMSMLYQKVGA